MPCLPGRLGKALDNTGRLFVRVILTHNEYDKGDWK